MTYLGLTSLQLWPQVGSTLDIVTKVDYSQRMSFKSLQSLIYKLM